MEESLIYLKKTFGLEEVDVRTYSPLVLAYIGDGIYDLLVRTIILAEGNKPVDKLHKQASSLVKAQKQSNMIGKIMGLLTEEEMAVYKRGRNARPHTRAKNASHTDYSRATGFEAVMGYLYLTNQINRIIDLIKAGLAEEE